jgi:hypothetical protein
MTDDIITGADLVNVPGVSGTPAELEYAARRAAAAVAASWCNPVDPAPQWVKDIAIDVAADYLVNPTGATSTSRSIDDASRTVSFKAQRPRRPGPFQLTENEAERLCPKVRRGVGSISLGVPRVAGGVRSYRPDRYC